MGPIGISSSEHMVCFLLYACLAASEYQPSHSSQLLALMKDLFALGDEDGITDPQCFSRSEGQILLSHLLSCLVLSCPHCHCPTSDVLASGQDRSLASNWPPCPCPSSLRSKSTVPQGTLSSTELPYHFQPEIFRWLLPVPMWNPSLACKVGRAA